MINVSRRTFLKTSFAGAGLVAAGGLVAACGSDSSSGSSGNKLTYQLSWTPSVQFGGTFMALDAGKFSELGLDVTLAAGGPNVAGDANTVSGSALVNISSADGVARSNAEGADLVIIGAQYQKSPGTILSLAEAPLENPQSLMGKKIGVAGADTPALDAFLTINNMTKSDVEFVPTQYDPAVLTAKQVDGLFCFYNDLPVALETAGVPGYSMLLADFGYNPMSQTYTVLRSSLEDDAKRKQVTDLFRADAQGWQMYKADPAAAADLTMQMYPDAGLDLETQKRQAVIQLDIMYSPQTDANGFGFFSEEEVATNLEMFKILGIEGQSETLWDHSILDEVYASGPTA
jgi:ABC-type nitrate/sulfonate/bicarbonate transport system substrate-binding protein